MPTLTFSDVFISYSRKDKAFAQSLVKRLKEAEREVWVDWEDIPLTANWWKEIQAGIEGANSFVFIITPSSVQSAVCRDEIDYALQSGKRLIPILHKDVFDPKDKKQMHPAINSHNWVFFREEDDGDEAFKKFLSALDTDLAHVRGHTRLLVSARDWDGRGRDESLLLSGSQLDEAEAWLENANTKQPSPTDLQTDFIKSSRKLQDIRRRNFLIASSVTIIITALAILSFALFQNASFNLDLAEVRGTEAQAQAITAQFNADVAATNAQDAVFAKETADSNAVIAVQQAFNAFEAQATANANANIAATAAQDALNAQSTADTLRLTAEGDAVQQGETAIAALATAEQQGTQIADALDLADNNARQARAVALASQAELSLDAGRVQQSLLFSIAAVRERAISWEAERALALAMRQYLPRWQLTDEFTNLNNQIADFAPDGLSLVTTYLSNYVRLWDATTGDLINDWQFNSEIFDIAFSPDGNVIAVSTNLRTMMIDLTTNDFGVRMQNSNATQTIIWSPSNTHLLGLQSERVLIWDAITGEIVREVTGHTGAITDADWNSDGTQFVTVGADGQLIYWSIDAAIEPKIIALHEEAINDVDWSPNGRFIATAGDDVRGFILDEDGEIVREITAHFADLNLVRWSPNSRFLITVSEDRTARIWNLRDESAVRTIVSNRGSIRDVAWSPDSSRIATIDLGSTVNFWNIHQEGQAIDFIGTGAIHERLLWGSDERYLLVIPRGESPPELWQLWDNARNLRIQAEDCCLERVLTVEESILADLPLAPSEPVPEILETCPFTLQSRLYVGTWGQSTTTTDDDLQMLNVRRGVGLNSARIDQIAPGQLFRVLQGPVCTDGFAWFEILYGTDARMGWVAEGDDATGYFVEPIVIE